MSVGRACIVAWVVAATIMGGGVIAAQVPDVAVVGATETEFEIVGASEVAVGENWLATAVGCAADVEWSAPGAEPPSGSGDRFQAKWTVRGAHAVSASCQGGETGSIRVFALDGTPFVEVGEVLNQAHARIDFEGRLNVDAVYGDAPLGAVFRLVLFRRGLPIPSGGRSEVVSTASGVARVDAYCLSPGPVHELALILEDQSSAREIAVSERLKIRERKLRCQ